MKLRNSTRFWTGAIMGLIEVIGLGIFGLTLIDWSWLTARLVLSILFISAIVFYNALAVILIVNGSGKEK